MEVTRYAYIKPPRQKLCLSNGFYSELSYHCLLLPIRLFRVGFLVISLDNGSITSTLDLDSKVTPYKAIGLYNLTSGRQSIMDGHVENIDWEMGMVDDPLEKATNLESTYVSHD